MSAIQFRLAARTDAAGKYNPDAPLEGNEDNMFVDSDLAKDSLGGFTADEVVNLSDKGCLMVVADGMGGMNAGEVASDIAIKTVMEFFAPEKLTENHYKDSKSRMRYMEMVVTAADTAIKKDSRSNPDHEGMGSTIIMAWLCDDEICLTWCGDSRAYLFRPDVGLVQVSKDHSYVQGLIDDGKITELEAFDHPYGNIITRSLGDPEKKAKADSKCFKVKQGDIFMLCSDGLSGVVRDRKTYNENRERLDSENLEDIITEHRDSMANCRDSLFEAALRNDWYDNVTVVLCEILKSDSGFDSSRSNGVAGHGTEDSVVKVSPFLSNNNESQDVLADSGAIDTSGRKKVILTILFALIILGVGVFGVTRFTKNEPDNPLNTDVVVDNDTARIFNPDNEPGPMIPDEQAKQNDVVSTCSSEVLETRPIGNNNGNGRSSDKTQGNTKEQVSGIEEPAIDSLMEPEGIVPILGQEMDTIIQVAGSGNSQSVSNQPLIEPQLMEASGDEVVRKRRTEEDDYKKCDNKNLTNKERIDYCVSYLKKWNESEHRKEIEGLFFSCYSKWIKQEIDKCNSDNDVDKILQEHYGLMQDIGLSDSNLSWTNNYVEYHANERKEELKRLEQIGSKG